MSRFKLGVKRLKHLGFTLIEMLTVIAIIFVLAGLVLAVSQYAQNHARMSKAAAEIKAMSNACESYKADNGTYPDDGTITASGSYTALNTATLNARTDFSPLSTALNPSGAKYSRTSLYLYKALSGDRNGDGSVNLTDAQLALSGSATSGTIIPTVYMPFKPSQLITGTTGAPSPTNLVAGIKDPFGNSYGYSTAYAGFILNGGTGVSTFGYNSTYDLWSTAGAKTVTGTSTWITNWR